MLADASGNAGQFSFGARSIDDHMAIHIGQRDEIAFRIDDALLHPLRALFQQAAQKVRFAGTRITLHEQTCGEKLFKIKHGLLATAKRRCRGRTSNSDTHVDTDLHLASLFQHCWNRRLARPCHQSIRHSLNIFDAANATR